MPRATKARRNRSDRVPSMDTLLTLTKVQGEAEKFFQMLTVRYEGQPSTVTAHMLACAISLIAFAAKDEPAVLAAAYAVLSREIVVYINGCSEDPEQQMERWEAALEAAREQMTTIAKQQGALMGWIDDQIFESEYDRP